MKTKLTNIRQAKGHSLLDASKKSGVSLATMQGVETGKHAPQRKTLKKLSLYYELDECEILRITNILRERRKKIERIDCEMLAHLSY